MPLVIYKRLVLKPTRKKPRGNCWRIHYGKYEKGSMIKGGRRMVQPTNSINLVSGSNNIPEKIWNQIKEHPDVKKRLENGELSIVTMPVASKSGETKVVNDVTEIKSLKDFSVVKALELIDNTMEVSDLQPWMDSEQVADKPRQEILKALEIQIKKINAVDAKLAKTGK